MFLGKKLVYLVILVLISHLGPTTRADEYHPHSSRPTNFDAIPPEEISKEFWVKGAQDALKSRVSQDLNENTAKNVIFFVGDGMDFATLAAARPYIGGEEKSLYFEKFPSFGITNTYCINRKVSDSACSATAYLSGVKANYGTIGVNGNVPRYDCNAQMDKSHHTESIVRWAQKQNKATGFVTTTKVTHATPAGVYAHTASRYWENDDELRGDGCDPDRIDDIAEQLIFGDTGRNLNVIMGGGRKMFIDQKAVDQEGFKGARNDSRNLLNDWENQRRFNQHRYQYVWNKPDLMAVDYSETRFLMGLFESDHCQYNMDIKTKAADKKPTLTEMVEAAVKILSNDPNGYFLFVEGGLIDIAHHESWVQHALEETAEMARAVEKARLMTNSSETLIVVSADHGHTLTYNGYPDRGSNIFGVGELSDEDLLPIPTLSYANGKGYYNTYNLNDGGRQNFLEQPAEDLDYQAHATYPLNVESHGGAHIGVWADGPHSHIFVGTYDQTTIPYLMAFAAKIGPYASGSATLFAFSKLLLLIPMLIGVRRIFN